MWQVEDDIAATEGEDPQEHLPEKFVGCDDRPRSRCAADRSTSAVANFLDLGLGVD